MLAPALTEPALLQALRARRFYASDDWNAQVTLTCNAQPMGSILTGTPAASLAVTYADADNEPAASITLLRGVPGSGTSAVTAATAPSGTAALSYTDPATSGPAYYYAIIVQADGDRIVTSPIWYTRATATATAAAQEALPIDVFPNPSSAGAPVTVSYYLPTTTISAEVLDMLGRPVVTMAHELEQVAGPHTFDVPTQGLAAGLYTVRLIHNGATEFRKLVVGQ